MVQEKSRHFLKALNFRQKKDMRTFKIAQTFNPLIAIWKSKNCTFWPFWPMGNTYLFFSVSLHVPTERGQNKEKNVGSLRGLWHTIDECQTSKNLPIFGQHSGWRESLFGWGQGLREILNFFFFCVTLAGDVLAHRKAS